MAPVLSIRIDPTHRNHHLWFNHGSWWVHYVLYEAHRRRRVRFSLQTRSVREARRQRDRLFARLAREGAGSSAARPAAARPQARRRGRRPVSPAAPSSPTARPPDGVLRLVARAGPGLAALPGPAAAVLPALPASPVADVHGPSPAPERSHA